MSLSKMQNSFGQMDNKSAIKDLRKVPPPPVNNYMYHESRYKIELCRHYDELGACRFGDRCLFAHGDHELRPCTFRHPLYRTKLCRLFAGSGFCVFGNRCSFIHAKPVLERELERLDHICRYKPIPMPENPVSCQLVSLNVDSSKVLVRRINLNEKELPSRFHLFERNNNNRRLSTFTDITSSTSDSE